MDSINKSKVSRNIEDARSWASSFQKAGKVESTIQCPHGDAVKIDIVWKGQVTDSIMACRNCWLTANDWLRVY